MNLQRLQQLRQELPGLCASPTLDLLEECLDALDLMLRTYPHLNVPAALVLIPRSEYDALQRLHASVEVFRSGPWPEGGMSSAINAIADAGVNVNNIRAAAAGAEPCIP